MAALDGRELNQPQPLRPTRVPLGIGQRADFVFTMPSTNGGPASPTADGWVNYAIPVIAGLMYRDSVEIDELKHPFRVESLALVPDSAGAGRFRGAPAQEVMYTALENPVQVVIPSGRVKVTGLLPE